MNITGFSGNNFLVNNPVWIDIQSTANKVVLTVSPASFTTEGSPYFIFDIYTFNNRAELDVTEIIKGLMPEPMHPVNPISGALIPTSSAMFNFNFAAVGHPTVNVTKNFIRGGEDSDRTNVQVGNGVTLKESEKIPVWPGYPSARYWINNGRVYFTNILQNNEIEPRRVPGCNPVFLRFLNSKGGYSFWLFHEWQITKKGKETERIERRGYHLDLGLDTDFELDTTTRVEQRYFRTLRALAQSPEIYIYQLGKILPDELNSFVIHNSSPWTRIYNSGNSIESNSYESMKEFTFKFDLLLQQKPSLIW